MKDHQKKFELKTPKIDPILDVFSEATEKSFKYKMKQKLLSVNQKVISKKVDLETFSILILAILSSMKSFLDFFVWILL